jgi:hypothetical protein
MSHKNYTVRVLTLSKVKNPCEDKRRPSVIQYDRLSIVWLCMKFPIVKRDICHWLQEDIIFCLFLSIQFIIFVGTPDIVPSIPRQYACT